jgi:hypothetical protein
VWYEVGLWKIRDTGTGRNKLIHFKKNKLNNLKSIEGNWNCYNRFKTLDICCSNSYYRKNYLNSQNNEKYKKGSREVKIRR